MYVYIMKCTCTALHVGILGIRKCTMHKNMHIMKCICTCKCTLHKKYVCVCTMHKNMYVFGTYLKTW